MWGRLVWCKKKKGKKSDGNCELEWGVAGFQWGEGTRDWVDGAAFFFYILLKTRVLFVFFTRFVIVSLSLTYTPTRRVSRIYNRSLRYTFGSLRIISNNALRVRTREKENFLLVFLKLSKQFQRTNSIDNRLKFFFPNFFRSSMENCIKSVCNEGDPPQKTKESTRFISFQSERLYRMMAGSRSSILCIYSTTDRFSPNNNNPLPPIHS
jgi:hypothetical protein